MLELLLIGIGTGNPDHITREAENAIRQADLVLLPHKEDNKAELAQVRLSLLEQLKVPLDRVPQLAKAPRVRGQEKLKGRSVKGAYTDCAPFHNPSRKGRFMLYGRRLRGKSGVLSCGLVELPRRALQVMGVRSDR